MKHLFVPYEIALKLKEKGFDEPCITKFETYINKTELYPVLGTLGLNTPYENEYHGYDQKIINDTDKRWVFTGYKNSVLDHGNPIVSAPLYQQVIDWFREKHSIVVSINQYKDHADDVNDPILWKSRFNYAGVPYMYVRDTYYEALNTAITKALELI